MAMTEQVISAKGHGLRFHPHSDILQSQAEFARGTFLDYMGVLKMPATIGNSISLDECFRAIPEMQDIYIMLTRFQGKGRCATVHINARHSGAVDMRFYQGANQADFETHWKTWYPGLADICHLSGPFTLALVTPIAPPSEQAISDFLHAHFLMCLSKRTRPDGTSLHRRSINRPCRARCTSSSLPLSSAASCAMNPSN